MANPQSVRAGRAFVELFADSGPLAAGLRSAAAKLKAWGLGVRSLGTKMAAFAGAAMTPMIAASKSAATAGAEFYEMAQRTGFSVEALSRLKYAADLSGASIDDTEKAIRELAKNLTITGGSSDEVVRRFQMLGLTFKDVKGLSPEGLFEKVAEKLSAIEDPTARAAAAMKLFGESGTYILPMLDHYKQLRDEAESLGFVMSGKAAKDAKEMANLWTILGKAMKSIASAIGRAVMPVLKPFLQQAIGFLLNVRDWIKQNQSLIQTFFRIVAVVFVAGTALAALGFIIVKIGAVFSALAAVVPVIAAVLSGIGAAIAFIATPVGFVIAAIAALAAYWAYASGAMGEVSGWLAGVFDGLRADAVTAFGGISDALASGNFGLAAQILWTTLKVWWTKGTNWISSIWNDTMGWLTQRFYECIGGFRLIFEFACHGLMVAWLATTAFLTKMWAVFTAHIQIAWAWCALQLQKTWNKVKEMFTDFDAEAANKAAQQAFDEKVKQLDKEADEKLKRVNAEYEAQKASEKALHQQQLQNIVDETEARKKADQEARDAKERQNQKELEDLQKQRDALVDKAKEERKQKELDQKLKKPPGTVKDPAEMMKGAGAGFDPNALRKNFAVTGSFNAMGAWALAAGSSEAERTAKATEKTAKGVDTLIGIVETKGGATFV